METVNNIAKRVEQFVAVRSRRRELKQRFVEQDAPLAEAQNLLSAEILRYLHDSGQQNTKIAGTGHLAFITEKASAALADPHAFMEYVKQHQAFDLLDRKANVTAVKDFIKAHEGNPPPGVNYSVFQTVNVRTGKGNGDTDHE